MNEEIRTLVPKLRLASASLRYLPRAFKLVWAAAPEWTALWAILLLAQGLLPVATVYLTRPLVNSLVQAVGSHGQWQDVRPVLILVGLMAGIMVLTELFSSAARWVRTA